MPRTTKTHPTHQAACLVCYACILATGTKRDCERVATGHMGAYGHQVTVLAMREHATDAEVR